MISSVRKLALPRWPERVPIVAAARALMAEGHSITSAARELGVAPTTLLGWLRAAEREASPVPSSCILSA